VKVSVPLGERVTGETPVPVRLAVCGLLGASSITVKVPESVPSAEGVNVMLIMQLPWAARGVAQLVGAKPAVAVMLLIFRGTG
jgi:hypothetical protein